MTKLAWTSGSKDSSCSPMLFPVYILKLKCDRKKPLPKTAPSSGAWGCAWQSERNSLSFNLHCGGHQDIVDGRGPVDPQLGAPTDELQVSLPLTLFISLRDNVRTSTSV